MNTETRRPLKTAGKNRVQIPPSAPNEKPLELLAMLAIPTVFAVFNYPLEPDRNGYKGMCEHSPEHSRPYSFALTMPW
nr:MAG TPA: hypothetical protein [Caudoviricetes sp.]